MNKTLYEVVSEMGRRGATMEQADGSHVCAFCQKKVMDADFTEYEHKNLCPWPDFEEILYGDQDRERTGDTRSDSDGNGADYSVGTTAFTPSACEGNGASGLAAN